MANVPASVRPDMAPGGTAQGAARGEVATWTVEQLQELAQVNSPGLAEAAALVDALDGKRFQAGLRQNPYIGYSGQQIFSKGQAEQHGFLVGQTFVRQEKRDWDQAIVEHEMDQAFQLFATRQRQLLTDVRLAFFATLAAERKHAITAEILELAGNNLATVERLVQAQESARVDQLRAELEVQRARLQKNAAEQDWRSAWSILATVTGQPDLPPGALVGTLDLPMTELDERALLDQYTMSSPEVLAAVAARERAAAALRRAMVEPLPDVSVQAVLQGDNSTGSANANLQVSFPVPVCDRNQGAVRQAEAELAAASETIRRVQLEIASRLAGALQRFRKAAGQVQDFAAGQGILVTASESLKLVTKAYSAGEISYLELLTAQRVLADARLLQIDALSEYWASRIEIEGMLLKGSLDRQ